jgi:hypothetical protein
LAIAQSIEIRYLAEVSRFDRADCDFRFSLVRKRLILLSRDVVDRLKTAVVPTKGIFLACNL